MLAIRPIALALFLVPWTPGVAAQQRPANSPNSAGAESDFGLVIRITPDTILNYLNTVADDMARDYELDDEQYYRVNEILHQRIPQFLRENNQEISRLASDFSKAWASPEPPDTEFVATWAERARPLLGKFHETVEVLADDMRTVMTPEQIVKLDGYLAAVDVGSQFLDQRLDSWAQGGFDPDTDWHRSPLFKNAENTRRQEVERRMVEARREVIAYHTGEAWADDIPGPGMPGEPLFRPSGTGAPAGDAADRHAGPGPTPAAAAKSDPHGRAGERPTKPRDKWEVYTEEFIARYKLDDAQAQKARLLYQRAADDRDRYERRRLPQLTEIARVLESAETPEQREPALRQRAEFESGLERMFTRLKDKLDRIPTRAQRRAVEQSEPKRAE